MWVGILVLSVICGSSLWAFWRLDRRNPLVERLEAHAAVEAPRASEASALLGRSRLPAWAGRLAAFGEILAGRAGDREKLETLLLQSSWRAPEALGLFVLIKTGLGCVLASFALISGGAGAFSLSRFALVLGMFFVGGLVPELILKAQVAKRQNAMLRSMPDALDLMVICAEAGLPFPRILKVVSKDLELSAPELADELAFTSAELQILSDRSTALRNLASRTRVPTVESMVSTLIQAERYGTPLAQALRNIAEESRNTLILTLEERAGKLPARLSIPLMTLILPPVVALVATPALMRVIRSLLS